MFYPLYWIYHDQWGFRTWQYNYWSGWTETPYKHRGHVHFFLLGHDFDSATGGKAYRGVQRYDFSLEDEWSNRAADKDPNQTENIRVIGTPKWHFWIREYWRRIYVQKWDASASNTSPFIVGKAGIKYDASLPIHSQGPYREGKDSYFYNINMARTLPIEYWKNEEKNIRNHWLKTDTGTEGLYTWHWHEDRFDSETDWIIPRTPWAGHPDNYTGSLDGPEEDNPARRFGYADSNYIYPTIEYQYVIQKDWERLPGWEDRDIDEETFGDGFSISISIPYSEDGVILSPFSDDDGNVGPFGTYYHGFEEKHPESIPVYPSGSYVQPSGLFSGEFYDEGDHIYFDPNEWDIPESLLGQPVQFNVPAHLEGREDGKWVEQCLGAIVRAKALVTIEDNFNGRHEVWVESTQFMIQENFAGSDQNEAT